MALDAADLEKLAAFVEGRIETALGRFAENQAVATAAARDATVGIPDTPHDAGPEFYVHLANGDVIVTHDSASTHMDVGGEQVAVIGRYQKGA